MAGGPQSQLSNEQKDKVLLMLGDGISGTEVAAHFGVSRQTILGLAYRDRERQRKANPDSIPVHLKKERDQRRAQMLKFKARGFQPKSRPIAPPQKIKDEPAPIGPIGEFPATDCCRYTKDDVLKPGWQMCGHPGFPWCDWHRDNRISPKRQAA